LEFNVFFQYKYSYIRDKAPTDDLLRVWMLKVKDLLRFWRIKVKDQGYSRPSSCEGTHVDAGVSKSILFYLAFPLFWCFCRLCTSIVIYVENACSNSQVFNMQAFPHIKFQMIRIKFGPKSWIMDQFRSKWWYMKTFWATSLVSEWMDRIL